MTDTNCDSDVLKRLQFIGLDDSCLESLRQNKDKILEVMPSILDQFYEHVSKFPETKSFFKEEAHIEHAKTAQIRHWGIILNGTFDDDYVQSVTKIGEVHNKLGLEPRWYIAAYSFLICGMIQSIVTPTGWSRTNKKVLADRRKLRAAVTRAAMLDMDFALSVYIEAGKRDRREIIKSLSTDFENSIGRVVGNLTGATTTLQDASGRLTQATDRTQAETETVGVSSTDAAGNVQTVAAAAEEMSASVTEIGRQVTESYEISDTAVSQSTVAIESVSSLTEAVNRVGEIVDLINDIAEKTNLLALNATIEAARAGEAGKGFAVVASEVKELAGQTAKATSEISSQIEGIQAATGQSASAIDNVNQTIARMNEISASIAALLSSRRKRPAKSAEAFRQPPAGRSRSMLLWVEFRKPLNRL